MGVSHSQGRYRKGTTMIDPDLKDAIHEAMQDATDIDGMSEEQFVAELSKRGLEIVPLPRTDAEISCAVAQATLNKRFQP